MEGILSDFKGNLSSVKIAYYSPNKIKLDIDGKKGFLVLSERYAHFPGWKAKTDGKEVEILEANNVITSLYLDNAKEITFGYKPKTFKYGAWISSISFSALIIFFLIRLFKKKSEKLAQ